MNPEELQQALRVMACRMRRLGRVTVQDIVPAVERFTESLRAYDEQRTNIGGNE